MRPALISPSLKVPPENKKAQQLERPATNFQRCAISRDLCRKLAETRNVIIIILAGKLFPEGCKVAGIFRPYIFSILIFSRGVKNNPPGDDNFRVRLLMILRIHESFSVWCRRFLWKSKFSRRGELQFCLGRIM